jgi:hypothetical protein
MKYQAGMRLRCVQAPLDWSHLIGTNGTLESGDHSQLIWRSDKIKLALPVFGERGWVMEAISEHELCWQFCAHRLDGSVHHKPECQFFVPVRAREVYDSEEFAKDVDNAINYVRSVALEESKVEPPQPHLPPGTSMRSSILRVCYALVLRQLVAGSFEALLEQTLNNAKRMLIEKNRQYGDSALNPVRVFSTASLKEQLLVRLDDKVSRLARGQAAGEDVAQDMLGYLLLVAIAEAREGRAKETP